MHSFGLEFGLYMMYMLEFFVCEASYMQTEMP